MMGRKKRAVFNHISDRIWKRIQGLKGKHLSKIRRDVLIKTVVQSIPTYCEFFSSTNNSRGWS